MNLYKINQGQLVEVREKQVLEREIQNLVEKNIELLMGLNLVKSEFSIKDKRIDTLAYDSESKAFIIIEYKRDRNSSVVDQGFAYLSLMLENKGEFVSEFNELFRDNFLKREEVDWSQTRVVFVSTSFTDNQIQSTNFKDIGIELWKVTLYDNDFVSIDPIRKAKSAPSFKPLSSNDKMIKEVVDEIIVYSEDDLVKKGSYAIQALYNQFKAGILNFEAEIEVTPLKLCMSFRIRKSIADIIIKKNSLNIIINLRKGQLDDPKNLTRDVSEIGHWGNGDYQIIVENSENLEYILSLIKQAIPR
jgi:predicted transport protein